MIFKLKIITKILLLTIFLSKEALAEQIKKITILGNERISKETIIMFSDLKLNMEVTNKDLNNSIKKLYQTGYFELINIDLKSNEIIVSVKENLIIQST